MIDIEEIKQAEAERKSKQDYKAHNKALLKENQALADKIQYYEKAKTIIPKPIKPVFKTAKGEAYASNKDSLSNFKRNAERLEMSPYQIWAVYFNKHVDSVNNAIAQNPNNPVDKSEGLGSRITDLINYAMLLKCLLVEAKTITITGKSSD